jgi:hypothetical protein
MSGRIYVYASFLASPSSINTITVRQIVSFDCSVADRIVLVAAGTPEGLRSQDRGLRRS